MIVEKKEIKNEDGEIGYIETIYESQNILQSIYFLNNKRLYITFRRGGTYSYENVPIEEYNNFENAESQGKYFHKNIRNNSNYIYRKEYTLFESEINELKSIVENNKKSKNVIEDEE